MALTQMWRRMWNFQRWKKATTPMLLNAGTGEIIPYSIDNAPTKGTWVLRRPLTLPESTLSLFLEVPLISAGTTVKKSSGAFNLPPHQIGHHPKIKIGAPSHPPSQQSG